MATKKMRAEEFGSVEEFRAAIDEIANNLMEQRKLELARDKKVEPILKEFNDQIDALSKVTKALLARCDAFAKSHRDEVFPKGTKYGETSLCDFFLRMGNPTLTALNSKWKEADHIAAAKNDPVWKAFVRVKESIDKDAVKDAGFSDSDLAFHGWRITQTERLTVEPKVNNL